MEIKRNFPNSSFSLFRNILILKVYKIQLNCERTTLTNVFRRKFILPSKARNTEWKLGLFELDYSKFDQQHSVHVFTPLFTAENDCPTACILFSIESETADETRINWDLIILSIWQELTVCVIIAWCGINSRPIGTRLTLKVFINFSPFGQSRWIRSIW